MTKAKLEQRQREMKAQLSQVIDAGQFTFKELAGVCRTVSHRQHNLHIKAALRKAAEILKFFHELQNTEDLIETERVRRSKKVRHYLLPRNKTKGIKK